VLAASAGYALAPPARGQGLGERFAAIVCPSTAENPRHDHAQIFPLRDGRLLLAWSEHYNSRPSQAMATPYSADASGDATPCRISARISIDRGRTWSGKFTLQDNIGAVNVKQSVLIRVPSGDVLLFFTAWNGSSDRRIFWRRSSDDCETWTPPAQFFDPEGFYILDGGRGFVHSSKRVILPAYWGPTQEGGGHFVSYCYYSDDDGRTWKQSRNRIDLPSRGAMEPAVAERRDGSLLVILRNRLGKLYAATSSDRGESWSDPQPTKLDAVESEPCLKRIPGTGDLLLIWNYNVPYALRKPPADGFGQPRDPLSCAITRDGGQTWQNIKIIEKRDGYDSGYPNVEFVGEEALVTFYQCSRATSNKRELMLKIFPIDWFYK
jgi:sialidase-1